MTQLNSIPIIAFKTAETFETWLLEHHDNSNGLWVKIYKKDSGEKTVSYAEALDVALCYGWIDGQKQAFDEQAWLQKFCPRREKSIWSKINIGHVERLIKEGRMRPDCSLPLSRDHRIIEILVLIFVLVRGHVL